jgi:hypothetical protein
MTTVSTAPIPTEKSTIVRSSIVESRPSRSSQPGPPGPPGPSRPRRPAEPHGLERRSTSPAEAAVLDSPGLPRAPAPVRAAFGWLGRWAPDLAAGAGAALFLTPARFRRPPREQRWLEAPEPFTVRAGGRRIAAWSWGETDRPAVLLVHGWAGRGSQLGAFAGALAAAGLRAVTFDAPGHGDSQGRRSSLLAMSDALLAVAESAGAVAGVVAHSAGAAASTWALRRGLAEPADRASGSTLRVVYVAPPAELSSYASTFAAAVGLPPEIAGRIQRRIERRFGVRWDELHGLGVARAQRAPLLVVHDRDDAEVPFADGASLAGAWPGARLHATAGLGHRRLLRDPEVVTAAVDFLTGAEAAAASA